MTDKIIIIESPNKCEKIAKITGAKVFATQGHFKTLANDFLKDYESYEPIFEFKTSSSKFLIQNILKECKNKDVIIATDPDREGYGIGYLFYEIIQNQANSVKRAEFHEITESGIKKGLDNAIPFSNSNLKEFEAFKARVVGDKLVGFILSPKYINKLNDKNNSVGRVQTPALSLIVKRELEIKSYEKDKKSEQISYKIKAKLKSNDGEFFALNDNIYNTLEEANQKISELNDIKKAEIFNIEKKQSQTKPPLPFRTSKLQEEANKRFKFSSEATMSLAQKLFEKGLITYHRTDSNALSKEFIDEVEKEFKNNEWYEKREYKAGDQSQAQAHEAIRVSHIHQYSKIDEIAKEEKLSDDEIKLYTLIFENTLTSQAKNQVSENTTYDFSISTLSFKTKTSKVVYDGFKAIFKTDTTDEKEVETNEYKELNIDEKEVEILSYELHKIIPPKPKHYKESNFISLLEKEGIGRPSTYAMFLPVLLKRGYIEVKKGEIFATIKGENFIDEVSKEDIWITKSEFTKKMEEVLDKISKNEASYLDFIKPLHEQMNFFELSPKKITPPSEKQLEFARKIASQNNLTLPQNIELDRKICSDFIEKNRPKIAPSQKQIEFAKKLSDEHKKPLPPQFDTDINICSKFIDSCIKKAH